MTDEPDSEADRLTPRRAALEKLVKKHPAPPEWHDEPDWTDPPPEGRAAVRSHAFRITIAGDHPLTAEIADSLYEAGCDDGTIGSCIGVLTVDFDREAESLGEAINSAIGDIEQAGFAVAGLIWLADRKAN